MLDQDQSSSPSIEPTLDHYLVLLELAGYTYTTEGNVVIQVRHSENKWHQML